MTTQIASLLLLASCETWYAAPPSAYVAVRTWPLFYGAHLILRWLRVTRRSIWWFLLVGLLWMSHCVNMIRGGFETQEACDDYARWMSVGILMIDLVYSRVCDVFATRHERLREL